MRVSRFGAFIFGGGGLRSKSESVVEGWVCPAVGLVAFGGGPPVIADISAEDWKYGDGNGSVFDSLVSSSSLVLRDATLLRCGETLERELDDRRLSPGVFSNPDLREDLLIDWEASCMFSSAERISSAPAFESKEGEDLCKFRIRPDL